MISHFSIQRSTPPSSSLWNRLEVAWLDFMIWAIETLQSLRVMNRVHRAWNVFDRQPAVRQLASFAVLALIFFCIGFIKGAL